MRGTLTLKNFKTNQSMPLWKISFILSTASRLGTKVTTFYNIIIPPALKSITPKTEDRTIKKLGWASHCLYFQLSMMNFLLLNYKGGLIALFENIWLFPAFYSLHISSTMSLCLFFTDFLMQTVKIRGIFWKIMCGNENSHKKWVLK